MKFWPFPSVTMSSPRWSTKRIALWQIMLTAIWNSATFSASLLLLEVLTTLKAVCPVGGTLLICFQVFSWFIKLLTTVVSEPFGIFVVWHNLQYAFSEQSLAYFNQGNVFSHYFSHYQRNAFSHYYCIFLNHFMCLMELDKGEYWVHTCLLFI